MADQNFWLIAIGCSFAMYLMRMVPFAFLKKKITNQFFKSFLTYIPFAVITSLVIPEVFHSTSNNISAIIGVIVAVTLSYLNTGLLTVCLSSTVVVYIVELFFKKN